MKVKLMQDNDGKFTVIEIDDSNYEELKEHLSIIKELEDEGILP